MSQKKVSLRQEMDHWSYEEIQRRYCLLHLRIAELETELCETQELLLDRKHDLEFKFQRAEAADKLQEDFDLLSCKALQQGRYIEWLKSELGQCRSALQQAEEALGQVRGVIEAAQDFIYWSYETEDDLDYRESVYHKLQQAVMTANKHPAMQRVREE